MIRLKSKIGLIQAVFFFLFAQNVISQDNSHKELKKYIENKFNVNLDSSYVITTHTKEDVYNYFTEIEHYSEEKSKKYLEEFSWRTNIDVFIDSVYSKDSTGNLNGFFIDYFGDSLSDYRLAFYKHGKKDSIEIEQSFSGSKKIHRYKNGVKHGIWESFDNDGTRRWMSKYEMGMPVDTSYMWWPNGNIISKKYHKKGKLIWEKCFEEDGKTEMECDF